MEIKVTLWMKLPDKPMEKVMYYPQVNGITPTVVKPPHGQDCRTCVQDCQFIGCYMPDIKGCRGYITTDEGER